jgi:AraC-like DNA-binding protein
MSIALMFISSKNTKRKQTSMRYHQRNNQEWLTAFKQYLESNLSEFDIRVEDMATHMLLSKRQLHRRVQDLTGKTPNQYYNDLKYEKSHQLLKDQTHDTVTATASAVGFRDAIYFAQQFKKRFGVLPSEVLYA